VVEIPPYFLITDEPLSVDELLISNITAEVIEEIVEEEEEDE
jgi:hypothetical protein